MTHLACRVQHSKTAEVMPFRREPPADAPADAAADAPADAAADAPADAPAEPPAEEYKDEEIVDCVKWDQLSQDELFKCSKDPVLKVAKDAIMAASFKLLKVDEAGTRSTKRRRAK